MSEFVPGDIIVQIGCEDRYVVIEVEFFSPVAGSRMFFQYKVKPYPINDTSPMRRKLTLSEWDAERFFVKCDSVYGDNEEDDGNE